MSRDKVYDGNDWNRIIKDGYLWKIHNKYGHLLCVPESKIRHVLYDAQDLPGHFAKAGTLAKISRWFFWSKQSDDVEKYVQSCVHCLRVKIQGLRQEDGIHSIRVSNIFVDQIGHRI